MKTRGSKKAAAKRTTLPDAATVFKAVRQFSECMSAPVVLPDSVLTVRVIGEFSAGKTRFLREMLAPRIPEALLPISSLERQTRLPLEITYAPQAELRLVERPHDAREGKELDRYTHFPQRAEVAAFDPMRYRLRLAIPEPRLILRKGDGYGEGAKRLALIDMPGWNSGDDELAESDANTIMTGHWNLALGYVCQASRLDGEWNQDRLAAFLEALAAADFIGDRYSLLFIITQCPPEDRSRLEALARRRVLQAWSELGEDPEALDLLVLGAEFSSMTPEELQGFRNSCWQHLLAPLQDHEEQPQHPWLPVLQGWPDEWAIRPRLLRTQQVLEQAGQMLARVRKDGDFLAGMNMYRLIGMGSQERYAKLQAAWLRQLGASVQDTHVQLDALELPPDHPLHTWWASYWIPQLDATLEPVRRFFVSADLALQEIPADTPDLQHYLRSRLAGAFATAVSQMSNGFIRLVDTTRGLAGEAAPEKVVATLLTLSLLHVGSEHYIETSS